MPNGSRLYPLIICLNWGLEPILEDGIEEKQE